MAFSLQENGFVVHTFYWTAESKAVAEEKIEIEVIQDEPVIKRRGRPPGSKKK